VSAGMCFQFRGLGVWKRGGGLITHDLGCSLVIPVDRQFRNRLHGIAERVGR
jgi:hypothetical protein